MCGIIGYIGCRNAPEIIYKGLKRLEYRGYDSCGIGIIDDNNRLIVRKNVGKVEEVGKKEDFLGLKGNVGIGHNRWATHGKVSKNNAHPHTDCKEKICIVHNGIISNYNELKKYLINRGHKFKSETDTEVVSHLIEDELRNKDCSKEEYINNIKRAINKIKGTYAILILNEDFPNLLVGVKNESPLLLGLKDNEYFLGSDISAFLEWTKDALPLEDGDMVIIEKKGTNVSYDTVNLHNKSVDRKICHIDWDIESAEKGGYDHFMLKEIMEEKDVVKISQKICENEVKELSKLMKEKDRIYIVGMGTSLHAAMIFEYWMALNNKVVIPCDASEFLIKGVVDENTLVVGITQSGETYDTIKALKWAKSKGAKTGAIVNIQGSTATRICDVSIMMGAGIEISVCATKTYISQLVILYRLFIEYGKLLGKNMDEYEEELLKLPEYISYSTSDEIKNNIKNISDKLTVNNYIFISKGINLPNALEGALKFKEITYLHAEGMSSGFLKHGTISLIDENMDTVCLVPPKISNIHKSVVSNIEEIKARNGKIVAITDNDEINVDYKIKIPTVKEYISPFLYAPICQLLAYYKAVQLGRDVDKPRGLAKSVTVE